MTTNTWNLWLITKGTVEVKILALQQKRALFDAMVGENNDFIEH